MGKNVDQPPKGKPNGTGKKVVCVCVCVVVVVVVVEIIKLYLVQTGRI